MKKTYSYVRPNSVNGKRPNYIFLEVKDGVKVTRNSDDSSFEHIFRKGEEVKNRTLKEFFWDDENKSVYVSSDEYDNSNKQSLAHQIDLMYAEHLNKVKISNIGNDIEEILSNPSIDRTETIKLVISRVGQGFFRNLLISYWGSCAVTGYQDITMLIASHIKPWSCSSDSERLDEYNGLLLTPTLDKAFDQGLISFSSSGGIIISPRFKNPKSLGVNESLFVKLEIRHEGYMKYHREHVYKNT